MSPGLIRKACQRKHRAFLLLLFAGISILQRRAHSSNVAGVKTRRVNERRKLQQELTHAVLNGSNSKKKELFSSIVASLVYIANTYYVTWLLKNIDWESETVYNSKRRWVRIAKICLLVCTRAFGHNKPTYYLLVGWTHVIQRNIHHNL